LSFIHNFRAVSIYLLTNPTDCDTIEFKWESAWPGGRARASPIPAESRTAGTASIINSPNGPHDAASLACPKGTEDMKYPIATIHERAYYRNALGVILAGIQAGVTQPTIVKMLANAGINAPTGGPFSLDALKGNLKQLRKRRGLFWNALTHLVFDGEMNAAQARPLLQRQSA
jgi:hypothetical protein